MLRMKTILKKLYCKLFKLPRFKKQFLEYINKCNDKKDLTVECCLIIIFLGKIESSIPPQDYTSYLLTIHNIYQNSEDIKTSNEQELQFARQELSAIF